MQLNFSPIPPTDLDQVINMFQAAAKKINRLQVDHWQYWNDPPEDKIQWVKEGLANAEYNYVKNKEGVTIGMLRILDQDLMYWGEQDEKAKYVHSLVVKEAYNGQGLGQQILEQVAELARQDQCRYLRLDADSKNPKLCQYYENMGFKQVGSTKQRISTYNLYQKEV
ncbi:GNAT family N-acetyltransferase [Psychroflexus tropicus]|uniref:GNAT family N-acetyltransferase n=1 Tax=Psychroflexus tropicus TaxID=197345 RepID=UPI00036DCC03|nr:GNAT family N-acetyltransferase [Psychroflexus tropicus]